MHTFDRWIGFHFKLVSLALIVTSGSAYAAEFIDQWHALERQALALQSHTASALVLGALLAVSLTSLMQCVANRRPGNLFALLMTLGAGLIMTTLAPTALPFMSGQAPSNQVRWLATGLALFGTSAVLFSSAALNPGGRTATLRHLFGSVAIAALLAPWLALAFGMPLMLIGLPLIGLIALLALSTSVLGDDRAPVSLLAFRLGWLAMLIGATLELLRNLGYVALSGLTAHSLPVALSVGLILLAGSLSCAVHAHEKHKIRQLQESLADHLHRIEELQASEQGLALAVAQRGRELEQVRRKWESEIQPDAASGLIDRHTLIDRIDHGLLRAKRHNAKVALLTLEIEGFNQLLTTFSHAVADELLLAVGKRLKGLLRAEDSLARLTESQFVIVLEDVFDTSDLQRILAALEADLLRPFKIREHTLRPTYVYGHAFFPEAGQSANALLQAAEHMMTMNGAQSDLRLECGANTTA